MSQLLFELAELPAYTYKCIDVLEFCKKIPDETVKLIITSPPYNIGKSGMTALYAGR